MVREKDLLAEIHLGLYILDLGIVFRRIGVFLPEVLIFPEHILLAKEIRLQVHDLDKRVFQQDKVERWFVDLTYLCVEVLVFHELEIGLHG